VLLQVRADLASTRDQKLGLLTAMVALGDPTARHVSTYLSDLEPDARQEILGLFRSKLSVLFASEKVRLYTDLTLTAPL